MTPPLFKIVFEGEISPGIDAHRAKGNLAALMNTDSAAVAKLFSGRPVSLKRNLPLPEAQRYLESLKGAGLNARLEAESVNALASADTPSLGASSSAIPQADPFSNDPGPLKVFTHHGRIGRLRYLAWTLLLSVTTLATAALISVLIGIASPFGLVLISLAGIALTVVGFQIGARRLHDIGWSGWWLLLTLVPYLGGLFAVVLMAVPGTAMANRYGPCTPANSRGVKMIASLWLLVIAAAFAAGFLIDLKYVLQGY